MNPDLPQNPWQLVKLNDMDYSSDYATSEPGSSSRLAISLDNYTIFQILNLSTGVSLGSNLHPVSTPGGRI
jgi:hypothetical protein